MNISGWRIQLIVAFGFACCLCQITTKGAGAAEDLTPNILLKRMSEAQKKLRNFQCSAIYHGTMNSKLIQTFRQTSKQYVSANELSAKEVTKLPNDEGMIIQEETQTVAFDIDGREKIESSMAKYDSKGNKVQMWDKEIVAWNGKRYISFFKQTSETPPGVTLSGERLPAVTMKRQPWRQFGGADFIDLLQAAQTGGREINVLYSQEKNWYEISIVHGEKREVAHVVPDKNYAVVDHNTYKNNNIIVKRTAEFDLINGVWFPVKGQVEAYFPDNPNELRSSCILEVAAVKVNLPSLPDDLFDVELPSGTGVIDLTTELRYIVGDSLSTQLLGSNNLTVGQVAAEQIATFDGKLGTKSDEISGKKKIFIPEANRALGNLHPFIFDLQSGAFVFVKESIYSKNVHIRLDKLVKGDIAWDGDFLALRQSRVVSDWKQLDHLMPDATQKQYTSIVLPERLDLPYSLSIITKENRSYLVKIHEIKPEGIWISYERIPHHED